MLQGVYWHEIIANPSGTILVVIGDLSDIYFYDFTDPNKDNHINDLEKETKSLSELEGSERYVLLKEAFDKLSYFPVFYDNKIFDSDLPINDV